MRYGLIGEKLGHSFSKVIHERLCAYEYDLLPLPREEVGPFLTRREFAGINVTIPYKETVLPYLTYIDPVARSIGAVNTIVNRDGLLFGYNTDAAGLFNTTPVGMFPKLEGAPVDLAPFSRLTFVVDAIYNPLRTRLLQQAQDLGIPCANGLRMLVAQAKAAAEHFLGAPLPDAGTDRVYGELAREMRSLALIGMPSCGKTTLGRLLAAHMGRELVDLDEKIARDAGLSIPEIFAREGETGFRARETAALREVAGRQGLVVATGGGIVKNPENVRLLRANAAVCFVQRGLARLSSADPSRPLSTSAEALARMYAERLPLYTAAADFSVSNDGAAEETARAIEDQFKEMCR